MDFYIQRMDGEFIYAMLFALLASAHDNSKKWIHSLHIKSLHV